MATDRERRLSLVEQTPLPFGAAPLKPEDEAFLLSLGVNTLKFINGLYQRYDGQDFEASNEELRREITQLDRMDKAGMLPPYWWQSYVPGSITKAVNKDDF